MDWFDVLQSVISGVISGVAVGIVVYWLDERRAKRERRLSDYRIASSWENTETKAILRNFDLTRTNLSGCKFAKANLEGSILAGADLLGANFQGANLRFVKFCGATMVGVKLAGANANNADFSKVIIRKKLDPETNFWSDFSKISLKAAKFTKARISKVMFAGASLRGTDFSRAIVSDCDFTGADFNDSNWKRVKSVENCIWKDVKFAKQENFPPAVWKEIQRQNGN